MLTSHFDIFVTMREIMAMGTNEPLVETTRGDHLPYNVFFKSNLLGCDACFRFFSSKIKPRPAAQWSQSWQVTARTSGEQRLHRGWHPGSGCTFKMRLFYLGHHHAHIEAFPARTIFSFNVLLFTAATFSFGILPYHVAKKHESTYLLLLAG